MRKRPGRGSDASGRPIKPHQLEEASVWFALQCKHSRPHAASFCQTLPTLPTLRSCICVNTNRRNLTPSAGKFPGLNRVLKSGLEHFSMLGRCFKL